MVKITSIFKSNGSIDEKELVKHRIKTIYPHIEILNIKETKKHFVVVTKLARICVEKTEI